MMKWIMKGFCVWLLISVTLLASHPFFGLTVQAEKEARTVRLFKVAGDAEAFSTTIQQRFPEIEVSHVYDTVWNGVAVKGMPKDLNRIGEGTEVTAQSPVQNYQMALAGSVPLIYGDPDQRQHHRSQYTGKGVKVGVIDTGIDYTHPDLKGNFRGGYDFIDQDKDPMETVQGKATLTFHGTHVAGIIGANGDMQGVAPGAELYGYRALGPQGMGTTDQVLAAIEKAVEDGMDVINLSLGNTVNGPDWPTSEALDAAVEKGVVAVTSSGNTGPGLWSVGSPGTSGGAISVGASFPKLKLPVLLMPSVNGDPLSILPMDGAPNWVLSGKEEATVAGYGRKDDMTDVKGKVALIKRGRIPFTEKAYNAQNAGAVAVLIYNNGKGQFQGGVDPGMKLNIPVASLAREDGQRLLRRINRGQTTLKTEYIQAMDQMAPFSSRGPVTHTWAVKPDVVAPGVDIQSTVPGGYRAMQGTSMAAPHVAGAAAVLLEQHPDWSPIQVKAALMNSAKQLVNQYGDPYPAHIQGAGRIQVNKAQKIHSLVYPSSLSFGQLDNERTKKTSIVIENLSKETKTYFIKAPREKGITWRLPAPVTIPAGHKKQVGIQLTVDKAKKGLHEGTLEVVSDESVVNVPFLYVWKNVDFPRIMGFEMMPGDEKETYDYEVYLPEGAEEMGILLYDPVTFDFIRVLDIQRRVQRGVFRGTLPEHKLTGQRIYRALVYARQNGEQHTFETMIDMEQNGP